MEIVHLGTNEVTAATGWPLGMLLSLDLLEWHGSLDPF
jgi:hypothetical protein